jgi:hypothetical protein
MILYHGSNTIVREPRIIEPNRTLDYGSGFYTTCAEKQAYDWAEHKIKSPDQVNYVNVYEFDEKALKELKVLWFDGPSDEWIDFVMRNRQDETYQHDYDLVYGPVANDKVYLQFGLYEQGFISKTTLLTELKVYELFDQMLFHTEKALPYLRFIEAKEVRL